MRPEHITGKKVLYGCLDWGSGHVARSIPLMQQLLDQGNQLVVRCNTQQQVIFETYGIEALFLPATDFSFQFKGDGNFTRELLRNGLRFRKAVKQERLETVQLAKDHGIDYIVSDHRYGMVHTTIPSFFVTHQVQLPPRSGFVAQLIHRRWIRYFSALWIMDEEEDRLAGNLSQVQNRNSLIYYYIGHYSRFSRVEVNEKGTHVVAVISGPEPYAAQLFEQLFQRALSDTRNWIFICPKEYVHGPTERVEFIVDDWKRADTAIAGASIIISRNGYSTLMDLKALNIAAQLIPTPGQLEQIYLREITKNSLWSYDLI